MQPHDSFPQPGNLDVKIWRYMDLSKYVALLQSSQLYFCRADRLGDKFEGSSPRPNATLGREILIRQLMGSDGRMTREQGERAAEQISNHYREMREKTYINCWHANEAESVAMWKLYAMSSDAVAIQARYSSLASQIPDNAYLGEVTYGDYDKFFVKEGNTFNRFMIKRDSFAHEHEVRAVLTAWPGSQLPAGFHWKEAGAQLDVRIGELIEAVFVSPDSPKWFFEVVQELSSKYGLLAPVRQSSLASDVLF